MSVKTLDRTKGETEAAAPAAGPQHEHEATRDVVKNMVTAAVAEVERRGEAAYPAFRDPAGPFMAKDAYIFVMGMDGVELLNPAFPDLEGRNLLDFADAAGKHPIREMLALVESSGSGWVDYMWPKPGEADPVRKSAYVSRARAGDKAVLVGSGLYLE